jgi:hypothetical protein
MSVLLVKGPVRVIVGKHPRFLWCARGAVCRGIGDREDGLVAVHFDDDLGIAGDFTGVEGTHADHCSRGDVVSLCTPAGGTRFARGVLPTLMLSAMVPDGGWPPPQQLRIRLCPLPALWLCGCCYALRVFVWDRGVIYGVLCGCCLCEALSRKQDPSGRKFNAGDPTVHNFGLNFLRGRWSPDYMAWPFNFKSMCPLLRSDAVGKVFLTSTIHHDSHRLFKMW